MEIFIGIFFIGIIVMMVGVVVVANFLKSKNPQSSAKSGNNLNNMLENMSSNLKNQASSTSSSSKNNLHLMIFGLIFTMASVIVVYFFAVDTKFICSRVNNLCSIEETNILGQKSQIQQISIQELRSAKAEQASSGRNSRPYNLILVTSSGEIKLLKSYKLDALKSSNIANEINGFINSQQEKIEINNPGEQAKIMGLFYFLIGLLLIFLSKKKSL